MLWTDDYRPHGPALAILFLLPALTSGMAPTSAQVAIPPAESILANLVPDHPRLLVATADFDRIKRAVAENDPYLSRWYEAIHRQADGILEQPVSQYEIPDGLRLLATSRRVVDRTYTLAMMYRMTGDVRYVERAWRELEAAAGFPDWNDKKHFLDTAEMTHALAVGYDWLHDQWTDPQRTILRDAIVTRGLRPALAVYQNESKHWGWHRSRHNWNQVCNGGITLGALAIADVEPELASRVVHEATKSITLAMAEFAPDGACAEGPSYWDYATRYNVCFLAALQSALGTDFGLATMPGCRETGAFPICMTGPQGKTFNFADAGEQRVRAPQLFWLARRFQVPFWADYQRQHASPTVHDMIWYTPPKAISASAEPALDNHFRHAEVVSLRSRWNDPDALFVGILAGDNSVNHSHLDLGSFVLDALGQRWVVDLGADDYNLPGYFDAKSARWSYYRMRAESHNTLVFNPDAQPDQTIDGKGAIIKFEANAQRPFAIADLTPAYRRHARSVKRGIALPDRCSCLIQDEFALHRAGDVWWFANTRAEVTIANDGKTARLQHGTTGLAVHLVEPAGARFAVMDSKPFATSPDPPGQNQNKGVRKLAIRLQDIAEGRIVVTMTPRPDDTPSGSAAAGRIVSLGEW